MSRARRLAAALLRAVCRRSSHDGGEWAGAMLRELDFVGDDGAAVWWALGCAAAILRFSMRRSCTGVAVAKKALSLLSGMAIAAALAACAFGFVWVSFRFFPSFAEQAPWWPALALIALPIVAFLGAAVALWRTRKPMAIGILLSALALGAHAFMYLSAHARG